MRNTATFGGILVVIVFLLMGLAFARDALFPAPPANSSTLGISGANARAALVDLHVAPPRPLTGYSAAQFGGWDQVAGCDTRTLVLRQQGRDVVDLGHCALAGRWRSLYDGVAVDDPDALAVDHLVPLANAWQHGAADWPAAERHQFATDTTRPELVVVTATTATARGDQSPATWRPPDQTAWCLYAVDWVMVKADYGLTVDGAERNALAAMLATCPTV